ncbi:MULTISPECIES: hypothetical protein [Kitasatospora]|uniref:Uncharacterized protein n=1 Tax=Kitasatospora setae (strain ATCC 33774 / DSM 43861 / JCM 3304 / KCC A-0304 / NBRC 14216 / KM-6054) TaxID=452652 RepID=E4NG59_KITSK|nr:MULTISPECIES: hypothetical protein [Kitasatospora]BAJ30489.1 hypothetical protein KSE_47090 [Kitasatospora setae KM-6054]
METKQSVEETDGHEEYEAPTATLAGTVGSLAAGSYSSGISDDGDYYTTKYQQQG